jgi:hypothetical protein
LLQYATKALLLKLNDYKMAILWRQDYARGLTSGKNRNMAAPSGGAEKLKGYRWLPAFS